MGCRKTEKERETVTGRLGERLFIYNGNINKIRSTILKEQEITVTGKVGFFVTKANIYKITSAIL